MPTSYPTVGSTGWDAPLKSYINAVPVDQLSQYSVKHPTYGATGNGTTNDTAAIHAARDAAGTGGVVYFPSGTYLVTGSTASVASQQWILAPGATIKGDSTTHAVNVTANGVSIEGPGKIDTGSGSAYSGVFVAAGLSDVDVLGVEITNGTYGVRCKGATGAVTTRLRVNGCNIHNTSNHGVFYNWETTDSEVSLNQIHDCGGNGVWIGNDSNRATVIGNHISNVTGNGIELPVRAPQSLVMGNTINVCNIGISLDRSDKSKVMGNTVISSALYNYELAATNSTVLMGNIGENSGSNGIAISAPTGTCNDNTVANNIILTPAINGIYCGGSANGAQRTRIIGNEVVDAGNGAGSVSAIGCATGIGCDQATIMGNTIRWTLSAATCSGINFNGPNALIEGNTIIHDSGLAATGGTGINIPNTGIGTNVAANLIIGNGKCVSGIVLGSTVTDCLVTDNRISGTTSNSINNNNATSATNQISGNSGTITSGAGLTYGAANHFGNRINTNPANFELSGASGTTAPGAGGAGALPATPLGYLTVQVNGTNRQIAYY